jgi:uncharacterized protein (TIGR02145 family)
MKKILTITFSFLSFISFSQLFVSGQGVTDIDGNFYPSVILNNGQEWTTKNLRTTSYENGDPISNITDDTEWGNVFSGAYSHYFNDYTLDTPYGKLYNGFAASDPRNLCPTGWHVPLDEDWTLLTDLLGGESVAGGKMKSNGTLYWLSPNTGATNLSGFSGLPSGIRSGTGIFTNIDEVGAWWSYSQQSNNGAFSRVLRYDNSIVDRSVYLKGFGFSVRCVKNTAVEINEIELDSKTLLKVVDIMGREIDIKPNQILIFLYSDGSSEKKFINE